MKITSINSFKKTMAIGFCALLLSSCAATKNAWNSTVDLVTFENNETDLPRGELKPIWNRSVGNQNQFLQMAVDGDTVYVVNQKGKVKGFNLSDGSKVFSHKVKAEKIEAGLGIGPNSLLMADENGYIYSINKTNGELNWKKSLNVEVLVPPVVDGNNVYVHGIDGSLYTLSALTGDVNWTYKHSQGGLTLRGGSKPLVSDNAVISGFADGELVANDPSAGYVLWDLALGNLTATDEIQQLSDIDTQPILDANGILYVSSFQGRTAALDIKNGRVVWEVPENTIRPFTLTSNYLYIIHDANELVQINRANGNVAWSEKYDEEDLQNLTAVFRRGQTVYVLNDKGVAFEVNQQDGSLLNSKKIANKKGITPPVNVGDRLIIITRDGKLSVY